MIYIILNYLLNVGVNKLYLLKDKHINILLFTRLYLSFCVLLIIHYMNIVLCNRTKIKNICSRQRLYTGLLWPWPYHKETWFKGTIHHLPTYCLYMLSHGKVWAWLDRRATNYGPKLYVKDICYGMSLTIDLKPLLVVTTQPLPTSTCKVWKRWNHE